MSGGGTATPGSPPRSTFARRVAFAAIAVFFARFVLFPDLLFVHPNECHTGAIAADLVANGLHLPLGHYQPNAYETGIVLEGFLAVPFVALSGGTALGLKLLAFAVGLVVLACGLVLVGSMLDDLGVERTPARRWAEASFVLLLAFAPRVYLLKSNDATGDHHEATALVFVLFVLLHRRLVRPSPAAFALLWLAAGFAVFWQKGAALAVLAAAVREPEAAWRKRNPWWWMLLAPPLFVVGYLPAILVHLSSHEDDVGSVASIFARSPGLEALSVLGQKSLHFLGATWLFAVVFALALAATVLRPLLRPRLSATSMWPSLAVFSVAHLSIVMLARTEDPPRYFVYLYAVLAVVAAALVGRVVDAIGLRFPGKRLPFVAGTAMLMVLLAARAPELRPSLATLVELAGDRARSQCGWRFGERFLERERTPEAALERCRSLSPRLVSECVSGIGSAMVIRLASENHGATPAGATAAFVAKLALDERERAAFSFGFGRGMLHVDGRDGVCGLFPGPEGAACNAEHGGCAWLPAPFPRDACVLGRRWECLTYADLLANIQHLPRVGRLRCETPEIPYDRYADAFERGWVTRPEASEPGAAENARALVDMTVCTDAWDDCLPR